MTKLPSVEAVSTALSDKTEYERLFGPLRRDDLIAQLEELIVLGLLEETQAITVPGDPEADDHLGFVTEQAIGVPVRALIEAVVLLKDAPPGRKPFKSDEERRLREVVAKALYQRKLKELGSAEDAAEHVSRWLADRGIQLSAQSILHGKL